MVESAFAKSSSDSVRVCPACGKPVDPLRAGHVAIVGEQFRYYCGAECKVTHVTSTRSVPQSDVESAEPPPVASQEQPSSRERTRSRPEVSGRDEEAEDKARGEKRESEQNEEQETSSDEEAALQPLVGEGENDLERAVQSPATLRSPGPSLALPRFPRRAVFDPRAELLPPTAGAERSNPFP